MLPDVSVEHVLARYVDGDPDDLGTPDEVAGLIADVLDDIQVRFGASVQRRLDAGLITPRTVQRVVANVVLRVLRNPDGVYREQLGTYNYQMSQKVASGYVMYLPEEIAALTGAGVVDSFGTVDMPVVNMIGRVVW